MRKLLLILCIALLGACKKEGPRYNGYIDADLTYLSSNTPGRLEKLFVERGQSVRAHQQLFKLEQTSDHYQVAFSQYNQASLTAQRKEIVDQIRYGEINYHRTKLMRKEHAASQNDLDLAKKDLDVLKNQLAALDFQIRGNVVNTADKTWQLDRKEGYAGEPGIIFDTYFTQDEYVQAGQPVVSLITRANIKVVFFVPETALSRLKLHAKVKLSTDGVADLGAGQISYISNLAQYTPPIIYSREARQSLVFRVEARLDAPELNQVHLGQPVTLDVVT